MAKECPFCHQPYFDKVRTSSLYEYWSCAGCGCKRKIKIIKQETRNMIPSCNKCNTQMRLREKGNDKFWGCPNWASCGGKTMTYRGEDLSPGVANPGPTVGYPVQTPPQPQKPPLPAEYGGEAVNPQLMMMNALQDIYTVLKEIRDNLKK
jgi:ssDNA-binding Zn-finger/Zn-ribbon topoisomerase 1